MRSALADRLLAEDWITTSGLERAFRMVPRELFVPDGTPLDVAYRAEDSVAVKRDGDGVIVSSISAPFIQARMIEQAGVGPGMSVLEVGSGGYNAALLAEVVGRSGRVVSVDIDADVTARARAALVAAGYTDRVTVVQADAEDRVLSTGVLLDAIVVTAGAWDIAPAWRAQLAPTGRLVLPLRMNGITRSVAFRRQQEHWVSASAEVCGFVPMQGAGGHTDRVFALPDRHGQHVRLQFDAAAPPQLELLDGALAGPCVRVWSGVMIEHGVSFADLHLWCAGFLPGFCRVFAEDGTDLAANHSGWFPYGVVRGAGFAYLAVRPALDGAGVEFGAAAYGTQAETSAAALVEQIQAWDDWGRVSPTFAYWPTGVTSPSPDASTAVLAKTHGRLTIHWPRTNGEEVNR